MAENKSMDITLALNGGTPAVTIPAPSWPIAGDHEAKWMEEVVRSGKWSWMGEHERAFCEDYASFIGTKHCLCLANGTVTIQCALQAVGIVPGDEVIVPGLTWVATAQAAMDIGANVVLVDIDPETMCIDPKAIEAAITPRTKAIVPVHLYGCMCDMDAIMDIAKRYNLKVVEDVAHQHGGQWRGKSAGAIGDAGSYSFQMSKVLPSGEGGAITCNDDEVYRVAFALKQVGWAPDMTAGNVYGHNYRITEMQCVLLRGGLSRLAEHTKLREENAAYLSEKLSEIGGPFRAAKRDERVTRQAYYAMTFHFDPEKAEGLNKGQYMAALQAEGFGVMDVYPPVYRSGLLNLYHQTSPVPFRDPATVQDYKNLKLPVVEKTVNETGIVMIHYNLLGTKEFNDQMIEAVKKVNSNLAAVKEHFANLSY
jgi:L-glutamine:2-deoxy-scyllo-inosose/3-amino-2,3-dideoxy-scyllo-inosose aminotransferase